MAAFKTYPQSLIIIFCAKRILFFFLVFNQMRHCIENLNEFISYHTVNLKWKKNWSVYRTSGMQGTPERSRVPYSLQNTTERDSENTHTQKRHSHRHTYTHIQIYMHTRIHTNTQKETPTDTHSPAKWSCNPVT